MKKISKKQLEKARMKWLVKTHIDLLRGWYSEIYGESLEETYDRMPDSEFDKYKAEILGTLPRGYRK